MPRRILLVITDLEIGGTPTVVRELATRLRDDATHVEVVSLKDIGPVGRQLIAAGIAVTGMNASSAFSLPSVIRRLRKHIAEQRIDTVVSFLIHANAVAALATPPGVRLFESIQTTQPRPAWHWVAQQLVAGKAERIIVPSPSIVEVAGERSSIPPHRFAVIPNAIDPEKFPRSIGSNSIVFIGRLDPVKRIGDLIEAVRPLAQTSLQIYGDGPERNRLMRLKPANVEFRGAIAQPQDALRDAAVLVLPSEAEGFGLVLIEAMAAGVPVIGTNVPGIRDVIQHEVNGLLVPVARPDEIRKAIERVISDALLRSRLIEGGLKSVREKYTWDVVLPQYRRLLNLDR